MVNSILLLYTSTGGFFRRDPKGGKGLPSPATEPVLSTHMRSGAFP